MEVVSFRNVFHNFFLINPFVLLTIEPSIRKLVLWPVIPRFLAVSWMCSIAPEIFAFLPPEHSSPIPAAPFSSSNITSSTANPKIFAGKFPINASFAWKSRKRFAQSHRGGPRNRANLPPPLTASCKPVQRTPLPVLPCFPFLTAPRLPHLSLPDPRPPDSRTPSLSLVCARFCRAECIRGWTFRSDIRKPASGFSRSRPRPSSPSFRACLHRQAQRGISLSAFPPPCTDSVSAIN